MKSQSGTVTVHAYIGDGEPDALGDDRCRECRLPFKNRAHKLPARTDEQRAAEARRTGDRP